MPRPIESVTEFYVWHHSVKAMDSLRLGQRFIIMYLKDEKQVPGLWDADEAKAQVIIEGWLNRYQYYGTMPQPLKGAPHGKCNRTACQRLHADWYNPATHAYYCPSCARDINAACEHDSGWKLITRVY